MLPILALAIGVVVVKKLVCDVPPALVKIKRAYELDDAVEKGLVKDVTHIMEEPHYFHDKEFEQIENCPNACGGRLTKARAVAKALKLEGPPKVWLEQVKEDEEGIEAFLEIAEMVKEQETTSKAKELLKQVIKTQLDHG
jgi:hypothetical protein